MLWRIQDRLWWFTWYPYASVPKINASLWDYARSFLSTTSIYRIWIHLEIAILEIVRSRRYLFFASSCKWEETSSHFQSKLRLAFNFVSFAQSSGKLVKSMKANREIMSRLGKTVVWRLHHGNPLLIRFLLFLMALLHVHATTTRVPLVLFTVTLCNVSLSNFSQEIEFLRFSVL